MERPDYRFLLRLPADYEHRIKAGATRSGERSINAYLAGLIDAHAPALTAETADSAAR